MYISVIAVGRAVTVFCFFAIDGVRRGGGSLHKNRHELFESVSEKENGFIFFELKLVKKVIMRNLLRNV